MLDGSFPPLLTPTPHRRVSIPTKHLRLTKREFIGYKWDAVKHHFWKRIGRHICFVTLPNIASLLFIFFMLKITIKGHEHILLDYNLAKAERSYSSLKEMDFRMDKIIEQQERIREFANREIKNLRQQLKDSVSSLKRDFFQDMEKLKFKAETTDAEKQAHFDSMVNKLETNFSAKLQNLYTELVNISTVVDVTKNELLKNQSESLARMEQNWTRLEENWTRLENIVSKKHRYNVPPSYIGVNLANRKLGAKNIPSLTSHTYSYDSYVNRVSAYFYNQDILDWPLLDRTQVKPGEAFCFDGNSGDYTVQLAAKKDIKSVMYEHDYWSDMVPVSAPKDYQVWTCSRVCNSPQSFTLAASCTYMAQEGPAQLCEITKENKDVHSIRIKVLSNHGQKYTCMYVLRAYAAP